MKPMHVVVLGLILFVSWVIWRLSPARAARLARQAEERRRSDAEFIDRLLTELDCKIFDANSNYEHMSNCFSVEVDGSHIIIRKHSSGTSPSGTPSSVRVIIAKVEINTIADKAFNPEGWSEDYEKVRIPLYYLKENLVSFFGNTPIFYYHSLPKKNPVMCQ